MKKTFLSAVLLLSAATQTVWADTVFSCKTDNNKYIEVQKLTAIFTNIRSAVRQKKKLPYATAKLICWGVPTGGKAGAEAVGRR